MTHWLSNDGGGSVELSATAAQTLLAVRAQLDHWWQSLDGDQVDYIVQNRDGELDGSYRSVVQAASLDPVTHAPHGQLVVTVADNKTGRFRLPELIRIYVDVRQGVHPPARR